MAIRVFQHLINTTYKMLKIINKINIKIIENNKKKIVLKKVICNH